MNLRILISLLYILLLTNSQANAQPAKGTSLPDFKFYTLDDKSFTRKNIKEGKKSIIILFDTGCDHCQREIKDIDKHYAEFKNTYFYLVSFDAKQQINKFMSTYGKRLQNKQNVIIMRDTDHQFIPNFQPTKFPAMYVYSVKNKLIEYIGGQKDIKHIIALTKK